LKEHLLSLRTSACFGCPFWLPFVDGTGMGNFYVNATKPVLPSRYQELLAWNFPWPIGYDEEEVEEMVEYLPRSSGLTVFDFHLWGHLKDAMCRTVQSQNYWRNEAEGSCAAIPVHTLVDVCHSVQLRSA
jgi:hypothetical protein